MKYLLILLLVLMSCAKAIEKPANLLDKDKMSAVIADFALADQLNFIDINADLDTQTRYILQKNKVTAKDFRESYTYYVGTNKLNSIFDGAQEIILEKDPGAEDYINKKLKENTGLMPMVR